MREGTVAPSEPLQLEVVHRISTFSNMNRLKQEACKVSQSVLSYARMHVQAPGQASPETRGAQGKPATCKPVIRHAEPLPQRGVGHAAYKSCTLNHAHRVMHVQASDQRGRVTASN